MWVGRILSWRCVILSELICLFEGGLRLCYCFFMEENEDGNGVSDGDYYLI